VYESKRNIGGVRLALGDDDSFEGIGVSGGKEGGVVAFRRVEPVPVNG